MDQHGPVEEPEIWFFVAAEVVTEFGGFRSC